MSGNTYSRKGNAETQTYALILKSSILIALIMQTNCNYSDLRKSKKGDCSWDFLWTTNQLPNKYLKTYYYLQMLDILIAMEAKAVSYQNGNFCHNESELHVEVLCHPSCFYEVDWLPGPDISDCHEKSRLLNILNSIFYRFLKHLRIYLKYICLTLKTYLTWLQVCLL